MGKLQILIFHPIINKIAFSSRGLLFVSDMEGKFVRELNTNPEGRVLEVAWTDSADLIFNQVVDGWQNLIYYKSRWKR